MKIKKIHILNIHNYDIWHQIDAFVRHQYTRKDYTISDKDLIPLTNNIVISFRLDYSIQENLFNNFFLRLIKYISCELDKRIMSISLVNENSHILTLE